MPPRHPAIKKIFKKQMVFEKTKKIYTSIVRSKKWEIRQNINIYMGKGNKSKVPRNNKMIMSTTIFKKPLEV